MPKRVFIIHGWDGRPDGCWLPWLKRELEAHGFSVFTPAMPNPNAPRVETWVTYLAKQVGTPNEETYFVGHSIGCLTILKYLETIEGPIGGVVFVAGWFSLTPEATPTADEQEIARQWLEQPIDFPKVRRATSSFTALFSDDDPDVPIENAKLFRDRMGAEIVIESGKGHFSEGDGVRELPAARDAILRYAKSH
ncbi:MAG: serine hydrolase family protein [Candidatus Sungbacteria bacterium]|nr:serine hydrolase family protein [Candidatus Sungbacteria bacterium]